jgi:hypothetical protein
VKLVLQLNNYLLRKIINKFNRNKNLRDFCRWVAAAASVNPHTRYFQCALLISKPDCEAYIYSILTWSSSVSCMTHYIYIHSLNHLFFFHLKVGTLFPSKKTKRTIHLLI